MWTNVLIGDSKILKEYNYFVPLVGREILEIINDGLGAKAEELWFLMPFTPLESVERTLELQIKERSSDLETQDR